MTEFSNLAPISSAITIASLNAVAAGSYSAPSTLVDNTATTKSYLRGWVRLAFSAPVGPAAAGSPYIVLYIHQARDGTNNPTPPGAAAAAPSPNAQQLIVQLNASATYQIIDFPGFDMDPFQYAFQIYNNSGVNFSGTATLTLYRGDVQGI